MFPPTNLAYAASSSERGMQLWATFKKTGELSILKEAIIFSEEAVKSTPNGHPDLAGRLNNLGLQLWARFERMGETEDADDAIITSREAVKFTAGNHPQLTTILNNHATKLLGRFKRTGNIEDLDEAITINKKVVLTNSEDDPDFAACLYNLGGQLHVKFEMTKDVRELDEAIAMSQKAVNFTPTAHPRFAGRATSLARQQQARLDFCGDIEFLALELRSSKSLPKQCDAEGETPGGCREARTAIPEVVETSDDELDEIAATPYNHAELANRLTSPQVLPFRRFTQSGSLNDAEEAIDVARRAVAATSIDHPH